MQYELTLVAPQQSGFSRANADIPTRQIPQDIAVGSIGDDAGLAAAQPQLEPLATALETLKKISQDHALQTQASMKSAWRSLDARVVYHSRAHELSVICKARQSLDDGLATRFASTWGSMTREF